MRVVVVGVLALVCAGCASVTRVVAQPLTLVPDAKPLKKKVPTSEALARQAYARTLERALLREGMNVSVTVRGTENTTLAIHYVLMSRPFIHNLMNESGLPAKWREAGFRKVVLLSGGQGYADYDL